VSAPLVVNTNDGAVWTRREGSRDGEALYAPEKCGTCPQFVMVTLTELAELGIAGSADALPVPVVPEPQRVCSLCGVVKPDGAAMRDHVRNVHPDEFCGLYHEQPCRHGVVGPEPQALSDADELAAFRALELGDLDGRVSASCGNPSHPTWLRVKIDPRGCPWCEIDQAHQDVIGANLARHEEEQENVTLRARVAELEAERHSTNEALSDAAERMRADRDRIAELEAQREVLAERLRAGQQWRQGRNPELVSENFVSQSELRSIFGIPLVAPWADGLTAVFSPVASLREPEGEHWAAVHHSYRVPRDLPETGGVQ
jgi:hypothetical protein